jgi:DNA-binding transcriptional ArsR family regulator
MSPITSESSYIHDAMTASPPLRVEVVAGASFELLFGLSTLTRPERPLRATWVPELTACSAPLRAAVDRVGAHSSELWLHLLGLALEQPDDIVGAVRALAPAELRRQLVGVDVPAWQTVAGNDVLEAAAAGNRKAIRQLLDHERYYACEARASLAQLLPLSPAQTKRRVLAVLERFEREVFDLVASDVVAELERDAAAKSRLAESVSPEALIAAAADGYLYEREPELDVVVLVPHLAARPWLLLCQHASTRIIGYAAPDATDVDERVVLLGRALGDDVRVRMLRRLAAGDATLAELAGLGGIAKSTAHHHLAHLRAAGLVTLRGNARAYSFVLRSEGLAEARRLLGEIATP